MQSGWTIVESKLIKDAVTGKVTSVETDAGIKTAVDDVAERIGSGHAFRKHADDLENGPEFSWKTYGIDTPEKLVDYVKEAFTNAENDPKVEVKILINDRIAIWDKGMEAVTIFNPKNEDLGSTYITTRGKSYFDDLKTPTIDPEE